MHGSRLSPADQWQPLVGGSRQMRGPTARAASERALGSNCRTSSLSTGEAVTLSQPSVAALAALALVALVSPSMRRDTLCTQTLFRHTLVQSTVAVNHGVIG